MVNGLHFGGNGQRTSDIGEVSVREAGRAFLVSLRASARYTAFYLDELELSLRLLCGYSEGQQWPAVGHLTPEHIESYLSYLQVRPRFFGRRGGSPGGVSPSYVATQYTRLRRFFRWLVERGHRSANPLNVIPRPFAPAPEVDPLTDEEMARLIALADPALYQQPVRRWRATRDRAILFCFLDTSGRRSELANLHIQDVDTETMELHVLGKGRKTRWLPLGERAQAALAAYLRLRSELVGNSHDYLWVDPAGRRLQPEGVYRMLQRLALRAGLQGFHPHRTRHNYIVRAVRARVPEEILRRLTGQKAIPETYFRGLQREDNIVEHRRASPLDHMNEGRELGRRRRRL